MACKSLKKLPYYIQGYKKTILWQIYKRSWPAYPAYMFGANDGGQRDKRNANRFRLSLPLDVEGKLATTRDVSASGLYFETDEPFTPGSELKLSMDLVHVLPEGPVHLVCKGRIVRVEPKEGRLGIAVTIDSHQFETHKEQA